MNNKGQSLIGVLISMGVTVVAALAIATIIANQSRAINTANANSDIGAYVNNLRTNMSNATLASNALMGNDITNVNAVTIHDPLDSTKYIAVTGYKQSANDLWSVNTVSFTKVTSVPSQTGLYRLSIGIVLLKDKGRTIGDTKSVKNVTDVYCNVKNNFITDCLGTIDTVTLAQQVCVSLSGSWNVNKGNCTLNNGTSGTDSDSDHHYGEGHSANDGCDD